MSQIRKGLSPAQCFQFQIAYARARLQKAGLPFTEFSLNLPPNQSMIDLGLTQFHALSFSDPHHQIAHVFRCGNGRNAVNHVICYPGVDNDNVDRVHAGISLEEIATAVDIFLQSKEFKRSYPGKNKTYFTATVYAKSALNEHHFVAITPSENPAEHMIINPKGRLMAWMTNPNVDYLNRFLTLKDCKSAAAGIQSATNKEDCGRFCAAIHYEAFHAASDADIQQKTSAICIEDIIKMVPEGSQQKTMISEHHQRNLPEDSESDDDLKGIVYTEEDPEKDVSDTATKTEEIKLDWENALRIHNINKLKTLIANNNVTAIVCLIIKENIDGVAEKAFSITWQFEEMKLQNKENKHVYLNVKEKLRAVYDIQIDCVNELHGKFPQTTRPIINALHNFKEVKNTITAIGGKKYHTQGYTCTVSEYARNMVAAAKLVREAENNNHFPKEDPTWIKNIKIATCILIGSIATLLQMPQSIIMGGLFNFLKPPQVDIYNPVENLANVSDPIYRDNSSSKKFKN